jgi:hypothetical protein
LRKSPPPHADSVEALVDVIQPDDPPNRSILVRLPESALTALAPKFPLAPLSETEQAALLASSRRVEPFADPSSADAERFVVFNASGGLRAQPFRADEKAAAGTGYVSIHCGALEVYFAPQTVAGHRWYPVRQIVEGIQMAGWTRGAVHWTRGGNVCRHPLARDLFFNGRPLPLPAGYVPFDEKKSRQYARILRNSRRLYFLNNEGGCYSMRLEKGKLLRTEVDVHDDGSRTRTVNAFGFEVGDSGVWQTGPGGESITYDRDGNVVGRSGWGFGTSTYYAVVGGNRHEIHLIEVGTAASISGYHPDSTQSWFLSRASCEAHLETNPRRRIDETRPIELGVRTDAAL